MDKPAYSMPQSPLQVLLCTLYMKCCYFIQRVTTFCTFVKGTILSIFYYVHFTWKMVISYNQSCISHSLICYKNNVTCTGIVRAIYVDYLLSRKNEIIGLLYLFFLWINNYSNYTILIWSNNHIKTINAYNYIYITYIRTLNTLYII